MRELELEADMKSATELFAGVSVSSKRVFFSDRVMARDKHNGLKHDTHTFRERR